jgi:hypothetical protein
VEQVLRSTTAATAPTDGKDAAAELAALRTRCDQLQHALDSRVVLEQAKGILAERLGCTPDAAFDVLRRAARSARRNLHDLAAEVVQTCGGQGGNGRTDLRVSRRPA